MFNVEKKFKYFDESVEKEWNGPFYFIQGADIQFGFISRELDNDTVITWDKENVLAENIVDRINHMNPKPRFFVMCGDLCDAMPDIEPEMRKKQEYDYKRIFGNLDKEIPLINVCGNHDVGNIPTPETVQMYHSSFGNDYFSFWCGGVLFLVINSQYFFNSSLTHDLAEKQNEWIEEKLAEARKKNKRIVVFQHIPWFLNNIAEESSYFTLNVDLRRKWLAKFKEAGVEAIFCGHYHRNAGGYYEGVEVVVTSAVGGQLGNDRPGARVVLGEKFSDETVKELENLKGILTEVKNDSENGNEVSITKSQTSVFYNINGSKTAHKQLKNEVDKNGKLLAKLTEKIDMIRNKEEEPKSVSQLEVEIPSKGIHKVIKNVPDMEIIQEKKEDSNTESKRARNGIDKLSSFSEIKYSPHELAEYIFWTGDEKGVAVAIEEFLQAGLMSRQEAINFLQSIKYNLDLMQSYFQGIKKVDKSSNQGNTNLRRKTFNKKYVEKPNENIYEELQNRAKLTPGKMLNVKSLSPEVVSVEANIKQRSSYFDQTNTASSDSSGQDDSERKNKSYPEPLTKTKISDSGSVNDVYDEVVERIKVADLLQKEYTLEEVIFELAKIMFSESLTKGNREAQKAVQKFSAFLQNQVERGQISKNLQKKIIDILLSALMDSLSDHPELLNRPIEELQVIFDQNSPTLKALKELLMLGSKQFSSQRNPKGLSEQVLLLDKKKLPNELLQKI